MREQVFIIAEAGVNHNGSRELAFELIEAASKVGADAVKFQSFKVDKLVCHRAPKASYQIKQTGSEESQYDMLKKLELSETLFKELACHCKAFKIKFLSTPFELESLKFLLRELNLPIIKLSSGEITNAPLLLEAARTRKPIFLSSGMATLSEIESALSVLSFGFLQKKEKPSMANFHNAYCSEKGQLALKKFVTLLHCTTEYPAPIDNINLNVLDTFQAAFGLKVGYSDHTDGMTASLAAVVKGAQVIEKHFTLDQTYDGPDQKSSLEPKEFKIMVDSIRQCEKAMGRSIKMPTTVEIKNSKIVRKSIMAAREIKKGEIFSEDNLICKRPGDGISPMSFWDVLGKAAKRSFLADELISL
jgi:N-acetylneuraminate synthase